MQVHQHIEEEWDSCETASRHIYRLVQALTLQHAAEERERRVQQPMERGGGVQQPILTVQILSHEHNWQQRSS
jgi:hypothetical protein